jgi:hypothetical protein
MDAAQAINWMALLVALAAVASSSLLTWRALRLNTNANHIPIALDALKPQRDSDFTMKELAVWEKLPDTDPSLGFTNLPEPIRGYPLEVGCYYQSLSYLAEYGIVDWDFIAVQTEWRLVHTWECIEAHVQGERQFRGNGNAFLNSYEQFVARIRTTDLDSATRRLYKRRKGLLSF